MGHQPRRLSERKTYRKGQPARILVSSELHNWLAAYSLSTGRTMRSLADDALLLLIEVHREMVRLKGVKVIPSGGVVDGAPVPTVLDVLTSLTDDEREAIRTGTD